jgi:hypothetical protein
MVVFTPKLQTRFHHAPAWRESEMKTNVVLSAMLALAAVANGQTPAVRISVRVVNSAKVADKTVAESERAAAAVLEQAGIAVTWRDCSNGVCPEDLASGEYWVHVAAWKPAGSSSECLGFTTVADEPVAVVYYPMVREMAGNYSLEEVLILGAALAHEIGHLLGAGHAASGVMSPVFNRERIVAMAQGALLFAPAQAARMRVEARRQAGVSRP